MIYEKYFNQIKIDKDKIENQLKNKKLKSYLISEMFLEQKIKQI